MPSPITFDSSASTSMSFELKISNMQVIHLFTRTYWLDVLSYLGGLLSTIVSFFAGVLGIVNYYIFFDKILKDQRIIEYQQKELETVDQHITEMYSA